VGSRLLGFATALRLRWVAAAALLTGTVASPAFGAAQPISPVAGATTNSHPTYTWTLPANEETDGVSIATRADTTPNGEFFAENIEQTAFFVGGGTPTQWTSPYALFAGSYWWNVGSHDLDTFATMFSQPPASFKVAPETRITRVRVTRHSYTFVPDDLSIVVRWTTNVREVAVEATIRRGNRRVGRVRTTDETLLPLNPDSAYLTWNRPRKVRTGTRLALLISVRGGGRVAAVRRSVLAP
jgi:hypothetical protein